MAAAQKFPMALSRNNNYNKYGGKLISAKPDRRG